MELTLALALVAAYLATSLGLAVANLRRLACGLLLVTAIAAVLMGLLQGGNSELTTRHSFAGFEGAALEVSVVAFPTGTRSAPAWQWPLPLLGFALLWTLLLAVLGQRAARSAYLLPLLFAWTGTATWLLLQHFAAPAALVQPVGIDRVLWPAGLAMALLVAREAKSLATLVLGLSLGQVLARLPAAWFSQWASENHFGTSLDVSSIVDIVNPLTQMQFEPRLAPGSSEQQFWLIWAEHVIAYPAFYTMSVGGIAFAAYMFHKHSAN